MSGRTLVAGDVKKQQPVVCMQFGGEENKNTLARVRVKHTEKEREREREREKEEEERRVS